ncbi:hypothetical protein N657DRAFT_651374 [Parathielavia appendiculata]|uniref:Uncharacterized protein n=1 Tax=Parathielavia appendiculata TaxID=2587402 RepID=A0AAN6TPQ5_9PEZI|nr:hypothetical protein N657DRAFT_651374 [Parathielavia appendiculata]
MPHKTDDRESAFVDFLPVVIRQHVKRQFSNGTLIGVKLTENNTILGNKRASPLFFRLFSSKGEFFSSPHDPIVPAHGHRRAHICSHFAADGPGSGHSPSRGLYNGRCQSRRACAA